MSGFTYIPKSGKIYVVTLTVASTWYQVLTEAQTKAIRGFKIKSRQTFNSLGGITSMPKPFDIAFKNNPDEGDSSGTGFYSLSGQGSGDTFAPTSGVWARSSVAGTILEIIIYE